MFTRSMKTAIHKISADMALVTVKIARKKCMKVDTIQNKEES